MKRCLVLGASGFIGMALCKRLKEEGAHVHAVDIRQSPFGNTICDRFTEFDLRGPLWWLPRLPVFDEVYQFACDLGGAGYILNGENDADLMASNVIINAHAARIFSDVGCGRLLFTSSACVYNDLNADAIARIDARDGGSTPLREDATHLGPPSSAYGWEKLFSEKLYEAHRRNYGLNVCITRFSTIYGPGDCFDDGREKAVAAICRKVLDAPDGGEVEVWGDGEQVRPLVYIDDLLDAITGLARCPTFNGPMNVANAEMTTCNEIARQAIALSNKRLTIKNVPGPIGKQVLNMSTELAEKHLGWAATTPFSTGLERTFHWIAEQKKARKRVA